MSAATKEYFNMLHREMALPSWLDKSAAQSVTGDDENSIDSAPKKTDANVVTAEVYDDDSAKAPEPSKGSLFWPIFGTGAGLFSDGYINGNASTINKFLSILYGKEYTSSNAMQNFSALTFLGTVVGMLVFGLTSDYWSRKGSMLISTFILIIFSILGAGSWGGGMPEKGGNMMNMLIVMRVFMGLGLGGEYPAGSVSCAEVSQRLKAGSRNRYFVLFTDFMIDFAFVVVSFVAWLLTYICSVPKYARAGHTHGIQAAWRVLMGLGAIPPLSLLYLRFKFKDSEQFEKHNLKHAKRVPWKIIIFRYGPRVILIGVIWFLYNFMVYSFGNYSTIIISSQVPTVTVDGTKVSNIHNSLGWNVLFNVFYLPGSCLGAFATDYLGPRLTLFIGWALQGMVGFIMGAKYETLTHSIGALVVCYGIFSTLGEFGPGDNMGLISSKTCASAIRGRYYSIAAALGKVGGLAGGYAFPAIAGHFAGGIDATDGQYEGQQAIVYVSSGLCFFAMILTCFLPELSQESIALEDIKFRNLVAEAGYDLRDVFPHDVNEDETPENVPLPISAHA